LKKYESTFTSVKSIKTGYKVAKNIWNNWNDITENRIALVKNLNAKNWKTAGENCGKIIIDTLGDLAPNIKERVKHKLTKAVAKGP